MCTAISMKTGDSYSGRNLDYEHTFGESIVITPRNYHIGFTGGTCVKSHYAMIGTALVRDNYPLYFDAANEKGLSVLGLNFPGNACYNESLQGMENVASYEFIPKILSLCMNVREAKQMIENMNITDKQFASDMPPSPLHWFVTDGENSLTVEQTEKGITVYDNPVGVLTNNPSFDMQLSNLSNYKHLSPYEAENKFSEKVEIASCSRGSGAVGLPGDLSSMSRFVRAAFTKLNIKCDSDEASSVTAFFHALYSVYQNKGCVRLETGLEKTNYSCCYNLSKGIYYCTTYDNFGIRAFDMHRENLDTKELVEYPLYKKTEFDFCN